MKKIVTYTRKYPLPELGSYNMAEPTETIEFDTEEYTVEQAFKEVRDDVLRIMRQDLAEAAQVVDKTVESPTPTAPAMPLQEPRPTYEAPRTRQVQTPATQWRDTKNPEIEWCPERDADPRDVEKALRKKNDMWTTEDERYGLAIFRKKPQRAPQKVDETNWKETKNPDIEWCSEKEATPEDVQKALRKEDQMWVIDDPQRGISIFRKMPKGDD